MNEWAELHGESPSDFDPEPEPEPNGEWVCRKCDGRRWTWKSGDDCQFCVRCNKPMIWVPDGMTLAEVEEEGRDDYHHSQHVEGDEHAG
jgi:hypothetical protein